MTDLTVKDAFHRAVGNLVNIFNFQNLVQINNVVSGSGNDVGNGNNNGNNNGNDRDKKS